ncbi:MAG: MFS transporter [Polyangiales bacterium]
MSHATRDEPDPEVPLRRNRDFRAFWLGQTVSAAGDACARVALPLLVLSATGSLTRMGQLTAVGAFAWFLAGLVSGPLVDRVDRRRLLLACDLGQGALYATVPLAWWIRGPSVTWLFAVTAAGAALGNLHRTAAGTAVQRLVPRAQLLDANRQMHGANAVVGCVGPLLAGLACAHLGPLAGVSLDALSFFLAALGTARVRRRLDPETRADHPGLLAGLAAGARFLWQRADLRALLVFLSVSAFLRAGADNLVVFHVTRDLGRSDAAVGAVFAVASAGSLAGAWLAGPARARWGFAACWFGAGAVMGASMAGLGVSTTVLGAATLAAAGAAMETLRGINTITLRQEVTPDHLLGRVSAVWWAFVELPNALGARSSAGLAARYGVAPVQAALGTALVATMLVGAAMTLTRSRRATRAA